MNVTDQDDFDAVKEQIVTAAESLGMRVMSAEELQAFMDAGAAERDESNARALSEGRMFLDEKTHQDVIAAWYSEARSIESPEMLHGFVTRLITNYRHDYGSICHALAAAALAGAYAVEHSDQGGITGFQSGAVMWQFIQEWTQDRSPKMLLKYENLLYPQNVGSATEISAATWEWMQDQVSQKLADSPEAHPAVLAHWKMIEDGIVPAPFTVEATDGE